MNDELIHVGLCSIPSRALGLLRVLDTLLPACDRMHVYLNSYPTDFNPAQLQDPKITVYRSPPDIGPRGKFYVAHCSPGYYLTVDDDLIYPADYVYHMVQTIDKYRRQAVIGGHGTLFAEPRRILFSHAGYVAQDAVVHMLGTGLMGYHSDLLRIDWRNFDAGKIDEQVAILGQACEIPMICLAHPEAWVREDKELVHVNALRDNKKLSDAAKERQNRNWKLYVPESWKEYQTHP